jgi:hypothetical protein
LAQELELKELSKKIYKVLVKISFSFKNYPQTTSSSGAGVQNKDGNTKDLGSNPSDFSILLLFFPFQKYPINL